MADLEETKPKEIVEEAPIQKPQWERFRADNPRVILQQKMDSERRPPPKPYRPPFTCSMREKPGEFHSAGPAIELMPPPLDQRKIGPLPPDFKTPKSVSTFMGATQVKLRGIQPVRPLGEVMTSLKYEAPIKVPPLLPQGGKIDLMRGIEPLFPSHEKETWQDPIRAAVERERQEMLPPATAPSQMRPAPAPVQLPAAFEEPKPGVSIERMVFLERVERIMASEARIKEIEAENKTLVTMVGRLQKELDELKVKLAART